LTKPVGSSGIVINPAHDLVLVAGESGTG
jgi:hypothetical protein